MKRVLMFSVSVLYLAVSVLIGFNVGSQRVEAQDASTAVFYIYNPDLNAAANPRIVAIIPGGETYMQQVDDSGHFNGPPNYVGNFWDGTVSINQSTWGNVKKQR
jgi:hypothetical protein